MSGLSRRQADSARQDPNPRPRWQLGLSRCLRMQKETTGRNHGLYRNSIDVLGRKSREKRDGGVVLNPARSRPKVEEENVPLTGGPGMSVRGRG